MVKRGQRNNAPSPFMRCFVEKDQYLLHKLIKYLTPKEMRNLRGTSKKIEKILVQNRDFIQRAMEHPLAKLVETPRYLYTDETRNHHAVLNAFNLKTITDNEEKYRAIRKRISTHIEFEQQKRAGKTISRIEATKVTQETERKIIALTYRVTALHYSQFVLGNKCKWTEKELHDTIKAMDKIKSRVDLTDYYLRYRSREVIRCPGCQVNRTSVYQTAMYYKMYIQPILDEMNENIVNETNTAKSEIPENARIRLGPVITSMLGTVLDGIAEEQAKKTEGNTSENPAKQYLKTK